MSVCLFSGFHMKVTFWDMVLLEFEKKTTLFISIFIYYEDFSQFTAV